MRPIALSVEGFGPFRDRVDVSFADTDFFALVGPTGAGKSSLIDAMCFALYGFVPRYGDNRLVAPAITLGASQARMSFTFDAAGERYVATRVVRRTANGASTKECRLERGAGDGSEVLAGDPRETDRKVQEILGLTGEHFTRCVVLPQGEFARFLHDKPADRQKLLVTLLGLEVYGQMATLARGRCADAKARADALRAQLAQLVDANEDAERAAVERVDALGAVRTAVTAGQSDLEHAEAEARDAHRRLEETQAVVSQLRLVRVPEEVTRIAAQVRQAKEGLDELVAVEARCEEEATAAEAACVSGPDPILVQAALTVRRELDEMTATLPALEAHAIAAREAAAAAEDALHRADDRVTEARLQVADLERQHAAHALIPTLVVGQPCPVCRVEVRALVDVEAPAAVTAAHKALATAEKARTKAETAARAAVEAAARAETERASTESRRHRMTAAVTDARDAAALTQVLAQAQELRARATESRKVAGARRRELEVARERLAALERDVERARADYTKRRDTLSALAPPVPTANLGSDWTALAAWAGERRVELEAELSLRQKVCEEAVTAARSVLARFVALAATVDIAVGADATYEELCARVVRHEERAIAERDRVRRDRRRAEDLRGEVDDLEVSAKVADEFARLMSARGFEAWVLSEALDELVAGASVTLQELSQGAYSLGISDANEFVVVDHREADAVRSAKTLSGGETFQASLALALALADRLGQFAAAGASRLESIFLDEGFGTLDEDSLDVVASTLETLAGGRRVVGVVTHVKELASRVPVRFEVRRTGRTAVVERVSSS